MVSIEMPLSQRDEVWCDENEPFMYGSYLAVVVVVAFRCLSALECAGCWCMCSLLLWLVNSGHKWVKLLVYGTHVLKPIHVEQYIKSMKKKPNGFHSFRCIFIVCKCLNGQKYLCSTISAIFNFVLLFHDYWLHCARSSCVCALRWEMAKLFDFLSTHKKI